MLRKALYGTGLLAIVLSLPVTLVAGTAVVPEIDGSSLSMGIGLLSGAVLILRSRSGARKRSR